MKGLLIIPVVDEFQALGTMLEEIPAGLDVLVVDDSGKKIFNDTRARVIHNDRNLGKGASIRKGFMYALENGRHYDYVVCMDSDGEHPTEKLSEFSSKISANDAVFGQRNAYRSISRSLMNRFSKFWVNALGIRLGDTSCGFYALTTDLLRKLELDSDGFSIDMEVILESFRNSCSYATVALPATRPCESRMKPRDHLMINNRFDSWVIRNSGFLSRELNPFRYVFVLFFSLVGYSVGNFLLFFAQA